MQAKQLQMRKEVMEEANKQIAYLINQLKEGPRKTMLHMKKIMENFHRNCNCYCVAGMVRASSRASDMLAFVDTFAQACVILEMNLRESIMYLTCFSSIT